MKKKWQIILGLVLSLATMVAAAVPALAQGDRPGASEDPPAKGPLAIIAPWSVPVDKEFTARVFLRNNQDELPGAGVWAISANASETLKKELAALKGSGNASAEGNIESVLNKLAIFLGRTREDGRVAYAFKRAGAYVLIAAKDRHAPAYTRIKVTESLNALGIKAPRRAPVGKEVTIGVFARLTKGPVEGAGVYAVSQDNIAALKQEAQKLKDDPGSKPEEKDYEALVKARGQFLGRTDKDGKLTHTFKEAGAFVLVAVKKGYFPGYAPINIFVPEKELGIRSIPPQTHVGKEVTLRVFDTENKAPVSGAGVWAMTREAAAALRGALKGNSGNASATEAAIASHGTFLGRTDAEGKLSATFDKPGNYVLVTFKKGYLPGFTTLAVKDLPKPEPNSDNRTAKSGNRPAKPGSNSDNRTAKLGNRPQSRPAKPGNASDNTTGKPGNRPQLPPNTN